MNNPTNISFLVLALLSIDVVSPLSAFSDESVLLINEVMSLNSSTRQDEDGDYSDWLELYNPGDSPIDLAGYGLSDRPDNPSKWVFPRLIIDPRTHMLIFASGKDRTAIPYLHTNFSLSAAGETLLLTDRAGSTCDEVEIGPAHTDISLGRQPEGASEWVYFLEPTPGESNTTTPASAVSFASSTASDKDPTF